MAKVRGTTKLRQQTVSGTDQIEVPSSSRPSKPPAKAITKRELEGLNARRAPDDRPPMPRRRKVVGRGGVRAKPGPKRAGKRTPRQARALQAAEQRAKRGARGARG